MLQPVNRILINIASQKAKLSQQLHHKFNNSMHATTTYKAPGVKPTWPQPKYCQTQHVMIFILYANWTKSFVLTGWTKGLYT